MYECQVLLTPSGWMSFSRTLTIHFLFSLSREQCTPQQVPKIDFWGSIVGRWTCGAVLKIRKGTRETTNANRDKADLRAVNNNEKWALCIEVDSVAFCYRTLESQRRSLVQAWV